MKRMLAVLVALLMACALVPLSCVKAAGEVGDQAPSLTVLDEDGHAPDFIDGAWNLIGGIYNVSGIALNYEGLRIAGDVTLNLDGATINHRAMDTGRYSDIAQYAPAISIGSGTVRMNLVGANAVEGSPGYAGIYVAEGATLIISGAGSLNASGGDACDTDVVLPSKFGTGKRGYFTAGAGIGGNGVWMALVNDNPNVCEAIAGYSLGFGTIQIEGGTVDARGGDLLSKWNLGGGAGIGAGGATGIKTNQADPIGFPFVGTVKLSGGDITATGGDTAPTDTGGGAGIGSGGVTGSFYWPYSDGDDIRILIEGGVVSATGAADGAGIGGGANVNGGIIEITAGSVTARGGDEKDGSPWGGAGIGGGEERSATSIAISGGTVSATGGGAAAGIGSGRGGGARGVIAFTGSAEVDAHGGSGRNGGAGIMAGSISLDGHARVCAYASGGAQGIVSGQGAGLILSDTAALWVQTKNADQPAIPGGTAGPGQVLGNISYSSSTTYLTTNYSYASKTTESASAYGWLAVPSNSIVGDEIFKYTWDEDGLRIDGNAVPLSAGAERGEGSWATLYREASPSPVDPQPVPDGPIGPQPIAPIDPRPIIKPRPILRPQPIVSESVKLEDGGSQMASEQEGHGPSLAETGDTRPLWAIGLLFALFGSALLAEYNLHTLHGKYHRKDYK